MSDPFRGAWVLVTGASSGIGEEFARQLAARGGNLVLTARSRVRLEELALQLTDAFGVETAVVVGDLAAPDGADALCRDVDALGVFVEHVVNNAGFGLSGPFIQSDAERLAQMVRLNCESVMVIARHFAPAMVREQRGGILNVASTAGHQPMPYLAVYAATKAFVLSLSMALSEELRPHHVRVSALCPGPVPTAFQKTAGIEPGAERLAVLSAAETVRRGLAAYERGDSMEVTGTVNRVQTLGSKLMPRRVVAWSLARAMERMGRAGKQ